MFHSAALKLTLWYLAIIMALSIGLSVIIYHLASNELVVNTRRQIGFFNNELTPNDFNRYASLRQQQLERGVSRLRGNLVAFNVLVLAAGGAASYALARRTLLPIEETLENQKRFTGDASHELRTPLAIMQTENEVTLRNPSLTKSEALKQLESNLEEVSKLKALSEGLLRLTSVDSLQNFQKAVELKEVVGQAIERQKKAAAAKKIKVKTELKDVRVRGDHESLVELISLLLDNAIKYSPAGGTVIIKTWRRGRSGFISLADKGQGIAAKNLPHIFERFYQTDKSRGHNKGYGLGLSIAQRIVEVHGGSVEVRSAPGRGSTFTVSLAAA
jgi:two-component system, OmpR family, sensor histidine kinase CiaH